MRFLTSVVDNFIIKFFLSLIIISVLPMIILWQDSLFVLDFSQTQIISFLISIVGVFFILFFLEKISVFPGQKSIFLVFPIIITIGIIVLLIIFFFRLPYSVYYLCTSSFIGIFFFPLLHFYKRKLSFGSMGYVPLGRCLNISETLQTVNWSKISEYDVSLLKNTKMNAIVADLSSPDLTGSWEIFLAEASLRGIPVYNYLQVYESITGRSPIYHVYENDLGALLPSKTYLFVKRIMDIVIILISLPVVLIIVLVAILAIRLESKGSVIYTQKRIGQGGKSFTMFKLRSMRQANSTKAQMASLNDDRITKVGKFIRKFRIDELPQCYNILRGEMSFIGPRPEQRSFVEQFNDSIPFYRYRHIVKPGLSGWAQVTHGYASDEDETRVKLEHDFYYIKNFSLTLDLLIVIKTIQTMLTGFGAR